MLGSWKKRWTKSIRSLVLLSFISAQLQGGAALAASSKSGPTSKAKAASTSPKSKKLSSSRTPSRAPSQAAQAKPPKWRILSADTHRIGPKEISIQNFERIVRMGDLEIPVAQIAHTVQAQPSNSRDKLTPQKVAEETRRIAQLPPWIPSKRGDIWVFVSDHKAANRYITLFYREHKGMVSVSISTIRRIYVLPVLAETEIMQKELARQLDRFAQGKPEKTASLWENALQVIDAVRAETLLPRAQAQAGIDVSRQGILDLIARLPDGAGATDLLNKYLGNPNVLGNGSNLGSVFDNLQQDLAKFNVGDLHDNLTRGQNQIDRFQGQIDQGLRQGDRALNIAQQGVDTARDGVAAVNRATDAAIQQSDKAINAAKDISRETNQTIRESVDKTNENARKIVNKMTSFETAFIMGLGGALGAAVGTMVVSAVVSAGTWAVKSLWNAIFGLIDDETRKQINANTQDGLNQLERQSKNITAIELELDKNIAALAFATNYNAENLAEMAGAMGLQAQVAAEIETNKLKNGMRAQMGVKLAPGEDFGDPTGCAIAANDFKNVANGLNGIVPVLAAASSAGGGSAGVKNKICQNIVSLLVSWRGAEAELQVARGMVLDGMKVMMDETASKAFRSTDPLASDRRTLIACESKISDMKDQASKFDRYSCSSKPFGTPECEPYHRSMAAIARWEQSCKQTDEISRARDFSADFMYVTEGLSHQMRQAQMLYEKLARANCPATQCAEEGEFSRLRQRYKALLQKAKEYGCSISADLEDHMDELSTPHALANGSGPAGTTSAAGSVAVPPGGVPGVVQRADRQPVRLFPPSGGGAQPPTGGFAASRDQGPASQSLRAFAPSQFQQQRLELIYGDHMSYR